MNTYKGDSKMNKAQFMEDWDAYCFHMNPKNESPLISKEEWEDHEREMMEYDQDCYNAENYDASAMFNAR